MEGAGDDDGDDDDGKDGAETSDEEDEEEENEDNEEGADANKDASNSCKMSLLAPGSRFRRGTQEDSESGCPFHLM